MGNWSDNLYKWSYGPLIITGKGPPCSQLLFLLSFGPKNLKDKGLKP